MPTLLIVTVLMAILAVLGGFYLRHHPEAGQRLWDWAGRKLRRLGNWALSFLVDDPPAQVVTDLPPRAAPPPPRGERPLPPAPDKRVAPLELDGIPADHALVSERIATFEPETDAALLGFYRAEARAALARGQAWEAHIELLVNVVGLDPAFTQVAVMIAEGEADMAEIHARIMQRFLQVYALVHQHLDEGGTLPFDGDFLTAEGDPGGGNGG